jgi:hypothetical protein
VDNLIFDVDIHAIPARGDVPGHLHYDIRFLLEAEMGEESLPANHETREVRWISFGDVTRFTTEDSVLRMLSKSPNQTIPA